MRIYPLVVIFLLSGIAASWAQGDGDYRSRATGNWFTVATWQVFFNGDWQNLEDAAAGPYQNQIPNNPPANGEAIGEILIEAPYTVTIDNGLLLDSNPLFVFSGATLVIANTPANPDVVVDPNSFVYIEGLLALENGATHDGFDENTTTIADGGVYEHRYTTTPGVIIGATWDDGSTIRFTGFSTGAAPIITFNGTENLRPELLPL
jgi:hypothetical protein